MRGFMVLLFGVSELLEYMREHRARRSCNGTPKALRSTTSCPLT